MDEFSEGVDLHGQRKPAAYQEVVSPCRTIRRHSTKGRLSRHSTKVRLGLAKLFTLGAGKPIIVQVAFAPELGTRIA
jgi:hypothetical protein